MKLFPPRIPFALPSRLAPVLALAVWGGLCLALAPPAVLGQGKLATRQPVFEESGHVPPEPQQPAARATTYEYADVVILCIALAVASYLSLKARSRSGMVVLSLVCLAYFGFWRVGCICPVGSTQNITLALGDKTYAIPLAVVLLFALPLLFTLLFGRGFCAGVCPLGAIQDVVVIRPVKVPVWVSNVLGLFPYLYLGVAVTLAAAGAGFLICRFDPFVGFFRLSATFPMLVFGIGLLVVGMFVGRPYCRFLCPYGVLLNWCSQLSWKRVTITPNECVQCRLCESACPFDAIEAPTPEKAPEPRSRGVRRLALLLLVTPVLTAAGAVLGSRLAVPLSRLNDTVLLAERLRLEETGAIRETTVETDGFRQSRESAPELYARALAIRRRIGIGGWFLGGFMGLVIGVRLIRLSIWRRRTDYTPNRGDCVSCARCFRYCPKETERLTEEPV